MTAGQSINESIAALQHSVEEGLSHFRRLEAEAKIRPGKWGPRETLCQLVWWLQASAEGAESVSSGGAPYRIYGSTHDMNARAVGRFSGQSVAQMADKAQHYQTRLTTAARALANPQTTVFIHRDGSEDSAQRRLEAITQQWQACVGDLQAV